MHNPEKEFAMLIAGIVIVILVLAGTSAMYTIMEENTKVADHVASIISHNNERIKEDVVITAINDNNTNSTILQFHNIGPEVEILEYRVLDDDGKLIKSCQIQNNYDSKKITLGGSQKNNINITNLITQPPQAQQNQALHDCMEAYITP